MQIIQEQKAALTGKRIDVNDRMLSCLVVDDHINAKQRHTQRLSQQPGQLPDDIITWRLRHSLDVFSLGWSKYEKIVLPTKVITKTKVPIGWNSGHTEVRSEDDSGLETLWLLKKMAFLSERRTKEKKTEFEPEGTSKKL